MTRPFRRLQFVPQNPFHVLQNEPFKNNSAFDFNQHKVLQNEVQVEHAMLSIQLLYPLSAAPPSRVKTPGSNLLNPIQIRSP